MEDLKLPIIKEEGPPPPVLSMDDYLKFVMFMKRTFGKIQKKIARPLPAKTPFYL